MLNSNANDVNSGGKVTKYSAGFAFNDMGSDVVLILKNRPRWQKGYYTGLVVISKKERAHTLLRLVSSKKRRD